MADKNGREMPEQMTLSDILDAADAIGQSCSSDEISAAITKLMEAQRLAKVRELAEQQAEQERIEQERRAELERARREREEKEPERQEKLEQAARMKREQEVARVRNVTSMDLPMNWGNVFESDDSRYFSVVLFQRGVGRGYELPV